MGNDIASLIATGITPMPHVDTPTEAATKAIALRNATVGGQDQHAMSGEALKSAQIENRQKQMDLEDQLKVRAAMMSLNPGVYGGQQGGAVPPPQVQAAMQQPQATGQPAGDMAPGVIGLTNGDVRQAADAQPDAPIASSTSVAPGPQQQSPDNGYQRLRQAIVKAGVQPKTLFGMDKMNVELQDKVADVRKKLTDADEAQGKLEASQRVALSNFASQAEKDPSSWDLGLTLLEHGTDGRHKDEIEKIRQLGQDPGVRQQLIAHLKAGGMTATEQAQLPGIAAKGQLDQMDVNERQDNNGLTANQRSEEILKLQNMQREALKDKNEVAYQNATLGIRRMEVDPGGMVSGMMGGGQGAPSQAPAPQQGTAPVQQGGPAPQGQQSGAPLQGEAYLRTLPPMLAAQVKSLSEGRSQLTNRSGSGFQGIPLVLRQAVQRYDPTFSENRYNFRKDFDNGKYADQAMAGRTALGHAGLLYDAGENLSQLPLPVMNKFANKFGVESGKSAPAVYAAIVDKLSSELGTAYGTGKTEGELKQQMETLQSDHSPETRRRVLRTVVKELDTKLGNLSSQWSTTMGPHTPAWEPLNPEAKAAHDRIMAPSGLPKGNGQKIDAATAAKFYHEAGNDPAKARALAQANGWK